MTTRPTPIRFAVAWTPGDWQAWHAVALREVLATGAELVAVIVAPTAPRRSDSGVWNAFVRRIVAKPSSAMLAVAPPDEFDRVPRIDATAPEPGDPGPADRVRAIGPDVVLCLGRVEAAPWMAECAPEGLWAFDHESIPRREGRSLGFDEIRRRAPLTSVALVRLGADGRPARTLHAGALRTAFKSYPRTLDTVLFDSAGFAARAFRALAAGSLEPVAPASVPPVPPARVGAFDAVEMIIRTAVERCLDAAHWLFRHEQWGIGIIDRPIHTLLNGGPIPPARWLPRCERNRFVADPFAVRRGDATVILLEEIDYREGKGVISSVEWTNGAPQWPPRRVMELPVHLSYPYIVEHEGRVYCIPETAEAREVALYQADPFPDRWTKVATLLRGTPALDTTVFRHDGRWWMIAAIESRYQSLFLHAWHAPSLEGPWTPHALNPLKTDPRSTRPAGTPFVHNGRLYRPAQDGSREYGGAVTICEVRRLTPTEFEEAPAAHLTPDLRGPYPLGIHTLAAAGDVTVIDGKRRLFVPVQFRLEAASLLRRALRRPQRRPRSASGAFPGVPSAGAAADQGLMQGTTR